MRRQGDQGDKKVSSQSNLESQNHEKKTDHDKIKEMEVKLSVLDRNIVSLKLQIKFIADILRKETPQD